MSFKTICGLFLLCLIGVSSVRAEEKAKNSMMMMMSPQGQKDAPVIEGLIPELDGVVKWYNSKPLTLSDLRGHVVLVDFWTYSCINCLRTLPYVKAWSEKYKDQGLIVIGVHSPEFGFEKDPKNLIKAIKKLDINYPVADDSKYTLWNGFKNQYWPAHYFIDRLGRIRHHHFGEGEYTESENMIRKLLAENGKSLDSSMAKVITEGVGKTFNLSLVKTSETYLGSDREENKISWSQFHKESTQGQWALDGQWITEKERSVTKSPKSKIILKFQAKDVHLVIGGKGKFKVTLDGKAPEANHGLDTDKDGKGVITSHRLYQLLRLEDKMITAPHIFEIEFDSTDVEVYAFTFG